LGEDSLAPKQAIQRFILGKWRSKPEQRQVISQTATPLPPTASSANGTQQPSARPTLRCRPDRDSGTPIFRDSFPFAADNPIARFHENEKPYFLRLRAIVSSLLWWASWKV